MGKAGKMVECIGNYLEKLLKIKQLYQKIERILNIHKELHSLNRYRKLLQEYMYNNSYDDEVYEKYQKKTGLSKKITQNYSSIKVKIRGLLGGTYEYI